MKTYNCERGGDLARSKPHLVVEVTEKRTTQHKQLCQEVLDAIKTDKLSIEQSKAMMKQLMIKYKVPLLVPGTYLNNTNIPADPTKRNNFM